MTTVSRKTPTRDDIMKKTEPQIQLRIVDQEKHLFLSERMDDAECYFKFIVLAPNSDVTFDESIHKQALVSLHEALMKESMEWHNDLIKNPEYKDRTPPSIRWDLEKAVATTLNQEEIRSLALTQNAMRKYPLYGAFREPPYGTNFKDGDSEAHKLFYEWIDFLGIQEQDNINVIDWVHGIDYEWINNDDAIPGRESWSDYFDAGLEWWGVWCLTIWNPKRRTISALIASTTD